MHDIIFINKKFERILIIHTSNKTSEYSNSEFKDEFENILVYLKKNIENISESIVDDWRIIYIKERICKHNFFNLGGVVFIDNDLIKIDDPNSKIFNLLSKEKNKNSNKCNSFLKKYNINIHKLILPGIFAIVLLILFSIIFINNIINNRIDKLDSKITTALQNQKVILEAIEFASKSSSGGDITKEISNISKKIDVIGFGKACPVGQDKAPTYDVGPDDYNKIQEYKNKIKDL
jgi:hypothetical protein